MVPFIHHMLESPGVSAMCYYEKINSLAEHQGQSETRST